jgi:hypothetical protein
MDANEIQGKPLNGRDELLLIRLLAIGYWLLAIGYSRSAVCHLSFCHLSCASPAIHVLRAQSIVPGRSVRRSSG